VVKKE